MIPSSWVGGSIDRLTAHSRVPLFRNAYALIVSSGATSALGLIYWIVAARIYSPDAVGFNAAAISAMMFLAGLAQLNLLSALVRFIPEAGRKVRRFVLLAYGISIAAALVASLAFLAGVHIWAPALQALAASSALVLWFAAATMAWSLFVLEDSVMTGLRRTPWVPVSNGFFASAKIVLLVALAAFVPVYGIFASWTLALAGALVLTNVLIFARLFPRHPSRNAEPADSLSLRSVAKYASSDYVASLFWLTCTTLLPVIVTSQAGFRATAYFFLAWQIGYSLHILSISTGSSLVVEAVTTRHELAGYSRRMFRQNLYITVPLAAVIVIAAPYIMGVFGGGYEAQATTLLRLLALASVPFSVVALAVSVARVQRRMRRVVLIHVAMCLIVLSLTEVLIKPMGLTGVGVAWLTAQGLLAGGVLLTQLRPLWAGSDIAEVARPNARATVSRAPRGEVPMRPALWAASASSVLRQLSRLRSYWRLTIFVVGLRGLRPELLAGIPAIHGQPPPKGWVVRRVISVTSDVAVLTLGPSGSEAEVAVLKLSRTERGAASLQRGAELTSQLTANPDLAPLHHLLPKVLGQGAAGGYTFTVEQALPGADARIALSDPRHTARMQEDAAATLQVLQAKTGKLKLVDDEVVRKWVDAPIAIIGHLAANQPGIERNLATLERLRLELRQTLIGRHVLTTWVHGDFVPGNILIAPESGAITGLIDWDQAETADLPLVDIVQLLLASHVASGNRELGELVAGLLRGVPLSHRELELIERVQAQLGGDRLGIRELVLLCWLHHISGNLSKSHTYARHSWWLRRNVEQVLIAYAYSEAGVGEPARPAPAATPVARGNDRLQGRRSRPAVRLAGEGGGARSPGLIPIPILLYHSVSSEPSRAIAPFAVRPEVFAQHLELIADGHVALTVSELVSLLDRGQAIPAGAVLITFDDGFADNLEVAAPMLKALRMPATIYLTTSYLEGPGHHERRQGGAMLSWSALADLEAAGFEIGAHGHRHRQFDVLPMSAVRQEITQCRELLEERLGHRVPTFAYPHGYSSAGVRQAVRSAGFDAACGVRNALSHPFDNRWSIARLTVRSDTPTAQIAAWLRGKGAPLAPGGEALATGAWRTVRRVRRGAVSAILAGS